MMTLAVMTVAMKSNQIKILSKRQLKLPMIPL